MMVQNARGAGWHCELCNVLCKDSARWLDHINGRHHLRQLGQTTQVTRVTLEDVRAKLDSLRAQLAPPDASGTRKLLTKSQRYDFDQRIALIAKQYAEEKMQRRKARRKARNEAKEAQEASKKEANDMEAMAMLGFGSLGQRRRGSLAWFGRLFVRIYLILCLACISLIECGVRCKRTVHCCLWLEVLGEDDLAIVYSQGWLADESMSR